MVLLVPSDDPAYLPPGLAVDRPDAIGIAITGGALRLEPVPECSGPDRGESVYSGRNVMLGYATGPVDLRRGRAVRELRTRDLARRSADGLFEVLGRRARFQLTSAPRVERLSSVGRAVRRVAVPSMVCIALAAASTPQLADRGSAGMAAGPAGARSIRSVLARLGAQRGLGRRRHDSSGPRPHPRRETVGPATRRPVADGTRVRAAVRP